MIMTKFSRNPKGKMKLSEALVADPTMGYFSRVLPGEMSDIMDIFMRLPDVHLIMIGPTGCTRVLYFRAERKGLAHRLRVYPVSSVDFTVGYHMQELEKMIDEIAVTEKPRGIVLNITCVDTLAANDFDSIIRRAKEKYNIIVQIYHRGPVINNREASGARFSDLFMKLMEGCEAQEPRKQVNVLSVNDQILDVGSLKELLSQRYGENEIKEFSKLKTQSDLNDLTGAELNILAGGFGVSLATEMKKRWGIPAVSLGNAYHPVEIERIYQKLLDAIQGEWDFSEDRRRLEELGRKAASRLKGKKIAISAGMRSLELAWTLESLGIQVQAVKVGFLLYNYSFREMPGWERPPETSYGEKLIAAGRDLDFYLTVNSQMKREELSEIDIAIGRDMGAQCRNAREIDLGSGFLFGYGAIFRILEALGE
jgi:Nitrogenase molybdenum-iron protein, alpha and beta chains